MADTKRENINVFICNQKSALGKRVATRLFTGLSKYFNVFWEPKTVRPGEIKAQKIFDALLQSDVLIVLLDQKVETSQKVRREVLTGYGAQVSLVPYVIDKSLTSDDFKAIEDRFGIEKLQYMSDDNDRECKALRKIILELAKDTKQARQQREESLLEGLKARLENHKNISVFISYRRTSLGFDAASSLYDELSPAYDVFWDKESMEVGKRWDHNIFTSVLSSDVLILLVEGALKESDWVEREITFARAARVKILPYLIDSSMDPDSVLEHLGVGGVLCLEDDPTSYDELHKQVHYLAQETIAHRQQRQQEAKAKAISVIPSANISKRQAETKTSHRRFQMNGDSRTIHLATGAMDNMVGIDVLVNTENNYLQMSRIHEPHTVSSRLRYRGAWINPNGLMLEDTVQTELDEYVNHVFKARPVPLTSVIPTHAGHLESFLSTTNQVRYIFHVVTTQVFQEFRTDTMIPIQTDEGMKACVLNALEMVKKVDSRDGLISPENFTSPDEPSPYHVTSSYKPINSIVFPIFGTGHAGRKIKEVITPMLEGVRDFLVGNPNYTTLQNIHVCVFHQDDIETVENAMLQFFEPIP